VPVAVIVVATPPACMAAGDAEVRPGTGFRMFNGKALELPPLGCGFNTEICNCPGVAVSEADMAASRVVELTNEVRRSLPFTVTIDVETKFVPVTVRVKPSEFVSTPDGLSAVIVGTGLGSGLIVNVNERLVPPPG
jgi:hypothetical protein